MDQVYAVGFADQLPCNRNNFRFGIGATLFFNEADAIAFKGATLYSVCKVDVFDAVATILRQDGVQRRHAESLGMAWEAPART